MKISLILFCMLFACGNNVPNRVVNNTCAQRHGTYQGSYIELSGNCGYLSDDIIHVDKQPTTEDLIAQGCSGEIRYSANNCEVILINIACIANTTKGQFLVTQNGVCNWSKDGTRTEGCTVQYRISAQPLLDPNNWCSSTYDVVSNRIGD